MLCSFALGMLLWCFFSGRTHAWADAGDRMPGLGVIARIKGGEQPDLAALLPGTPAPVRALIERCWAQAAADRPTARAIAQEFAGLAVRRAMSKGNRGEMLECRYPALPAIAHFQAPLRSPPLPLPGP